MLVRSKLMRWSVRAVSAAALLALPATAHHSTAMFAWGKEVTIRNAIVDRWDWTNPHTFLYVTARSDKGVMEKWAFEGMSPNHLGRIGWSKNSLKPGDKIDLTYYALKDGRKGGFNVTVTLANGTTKKQLESPSVRPGSAE